MEKQLLLAIVISLLALFAFQYYQGYRTGRTAKKDRTAPTAALPKPVSVPIPRNETNATEQKLYIDGELYRAALDNRGGVLTGWELKQYRSAPISGRGDSE